MSDDQLQNGARQLLQVLSELEAGKGFDLAQIAEHVGITDPDAIKQIALDLKAQGIVALIEDKDSGRPLIALLPAAAESDEDKEEEKSIIVDAGISLTGSLGSSPKKSAPEGPGRIAVATPAQAPAPAPTAANRPGAAETITIKQILLDLAEAVEKSDSIEDREKWPLVEKIRAIASNRAISPWLTAPLKDIVDT